MALENLYFEEVNFSVNIFLSDDMLRVCGVKCLYIFKTEVVETIHEALFSEKIHFAKIKTLNNMIKILIRIHVLNLTFM